MKPSVASRGVRRGRAPRSTRPAALANEATQLLGRWSRLSPGRLGSPISCACCVAIPGVTVGDLEHDILGYLHDRHAAAGTPGAMTLLERDAGFRAGGGGSVGSLLRALARRDPGPAEETGPRALLADLARCIESLEEQQRGIA